MVRRGLCNFQLQAACSIGERRAADADQAGSRGLRSGHRALNGRSEKRTCLGLAAGPAGNVAWKMVKNRLEPAAHASAVRGTVCRRAGRLRAQEVSKPGIDPARSATTAPG